MNIINPYRFAADTGIKNGLVAWYDLEETSGTRSDAHSNSLDLTENGTVGSSAGKVGDCAFKTLENTDSLYHADDALFDITGDMTIAGWVYFTDKTYNMAIASKWLGTGSQRSYLLYKPAGFTTIRLFASQNGAIADLQLESAAQSTSQWVFAAGVFVAGGTSTLYINGSSVDSGASPSALYSGSARFEMFSFNTGSVTAQDGGIDSVGIWNRALDASEITTLWNSGSGVSYADL